MWVALGAGGLVFSWPPGHLLGGPFRDEAPGPPTLPLLGFPNDLVQYLCLSQSAPQCLDIVDLGTAPFSTTMPSTALPTQTYADQPSPALPHTAPHRPATPGTSCPAQPHSDQPHPAPPSSDPQKLEQQGCGSSMEAGVHEQRVWKGGARQ